MQVDSSNVEEIVQALLAFIDTTDLPDGSKRLLKIHLRFLIKHKQTTQ